MANSFSSNVDRLCSRCKTRQGISKRSKVSEKDCLLCCGIFLNIEELGKKSVGILKSVEGDVKTFAVGHRIPKYMDSFEEKVWEQVDITKAESIKGELNRELGKYIEKHSKFKFKSHPDVRLLINPITKEIENKISNVYYYGRYKKLKRFVRQTKRRDSDDESVEEFMENPILKLIGGTKAVLHGCLAGNTNILLNECSGDIEKLKNKYKEHEVVCYDTSTGKLKTSKITDWFKLKHNAFKIKTRETGREVIATLEHPFFTEEGMKPLGGLQIGDKVAVNPNVRENIKTNKSKLVVVQNNITNAIQQYIPTSNKKRIFKELRDKHLLPLAENNPKTSILVRMIGFLFGDGNVKVIRNRDVGLEFYGQKIDLETIKKDLKHLGFYSNIVLKKSPACSVMDYYGNVRTIKSTSSYTLTCYSKSLWILLVSLGAPVGNKVKNDLNIPKWIKSSSRLVKQEFLASLLGCEIDKPRLDKRKYNRKSFNSPRFSMNKIERNLNNGLKFIRNLANLLKEFDVRTFPIQKVPYSTRKDGDKTIKIILGISNEFTNLINLWKNVGYRYCKEKEILATYALEYLDTKKKNIEIRQILFKKAQELHKGGKTLSEIHMLLGSSLLSKKNLWMWIHNKVKIQNIKVQNGFPEFDLWLRKVSKDLSDGLVWETIESIEPIGKIPVYDITAPVNSNFFANGFLVSNSGREDIDALMIGSGRPFVVEIMNPKFRRFSAKKIESAINKSAKGAIKIVGLKKSDKGQIEIIKRAKFDKTYDAEVEVDKPVSAEDLKNIPESVMLNQRTPLRVLSRRADLIRKRRVKSIKTEIGKKKSKIFRMRLVTQAGTYVKEFISGDEGRTIPSVSAMLKRKAKCIELNVIEVHGKWYEDFW